MQPLYKACLIGAGLSALALVGILVFGGGIAAAGPFAVAFFALLAVGLLLVLAAVIHNAAGYLLGYWGCRLLGMEENDCRTISIEVGMQNGGLASGIAMQMGRVATVGLAPAVFGPWMNITGSALANYWRRKVMLEEEEEAADEEAGLEERAGAAAPTSADAS